MWWLRRLFCLVCLLAPAAQAEEAYPARPVRIVVAFPAGGSVDIVARLVGQALAQRLGQPFVVDNRSGASGNIGTEVVARSAPDGYTLLMAGAGPIVTSPSLNMGLSYNPQRDLAPITLIALQPNMVVVHPSLPVNSLADFIAYAKANPGRVNYGTAGIGTSQHLAAEAFRLRTGVDIVHVPYRGGAPALGDLIAGRLQVMFETIPTALQAVRGGQLRPLAVTTLERAAAMPELPTIAEAGLPGYESRAWIGLLDPTGVPAVIIDALNRHVAAIIAQPEARARLLDLGLQIRASPPDEFDAFLRQEFIVNRDLVAAAHITLD